MSIISYLNGEFLPLERAAVPIEERGHQFGDGVYEVVRVYGGRPFLLEWHLERLERSLAAISIQNPYTKSEWTNVIHEAIRRSQEAEATVYWQVTRGIAPRSHGFPATAASVSLVVRPLPGAQDRPEPVKLFALPDQRWANAYVKTINLLPNVLAKEAAHHAGAFEALLVREDVLTEGSSSNVWFVRAGRLYTHPQNRYILAGITRRFVLELAERLNLSVSEQEFRVEDLAEVDEVFLTGTTSEIRLVHEIFTDQAIRPELHQLSANPPHGLVPPVQNLQVLWRQADEHFVASRLQQAFAAAIDDFRLYGAPFPAL